jgi:hypothetical protein
MRIIIFIFSFFLFSKMNSQDLIKLRTGEVYKVKVLEITDNEARFKMENNPNGPVYSIHKDNFSSIIYQNGIEESIFSTEQQTTIRINGFNTSVTNSSGSTSTDITDRTSSKEKSSPGQVIGAILGMGFLILNIMADMDSDCNTQKTCCPTSQKCYRCR